MERNGTALPFLLIIQYTNHSKFSSSAKETAALNNLIKSTFNSADTKTLQSYQMIKSCGKKNGVKYTSIKKTFPAELQSAIFYYYGNKNLQNIYSRSE
jgi:hypothetical protein